MAGVKPVSDFDAGVTSDYLNKAGALFELAIEFAQEVLAASPRSMPAGKQ
jgi:hypothetical protein